MKKILASAFCAVLAACTCAQTVDPIIMRIAGQDVTRSEFEYNFNKNNSEGVVDQKSIDEYVPLFVNYKLKVQAAMDARMDTAQSFRDEFRTYRDQLIRPMLVPAEAEEKEVRGYYDQMQSQLNGHDLRLPAHIFLRVSQKGSVEEQQIKKARIDSIYNALKQGASFEELAKKHSEEQQTAVRGGELTWFGPGQLVPEFENVMYALNKGEMSEPFLSTYGYHIVRLNDCKQLESYEELRPQIAQFLENRGLRDHLAQQVSDSLARQGGISIEELMDKETERICAQDMETKYLVQEYHDGLLMYDIWKERVVDAAVSDTAYLEKFFKVNQKSYGWQIPHFYGMVYYARNASDVKRVKKMLKGVDESKWITTVRENCNKDSVMVRMQQKLFAMGDDAVVDSLVFKQKNGKTKVRQDFPYSGAVGRVMKKVPQKWTDVSKQVIDDVQAKREQEFVAELRKRYPVVVYGDVLRTVNNH